jgi:hypothetical protein
MLIAHAVGELIETKNQEEDNNGWVEEDKFPKII